MSTQPELRHVSASVAEKVDSNSAAPDGRLVEIVPRQFVPTDELIAALSDLPPLDITKLREDGDHFFDDQGDRVV